MFSIKEAVKLGWEKTKANFWKSVGITFISLSLPFLMEMLTGAVEHRGSILSLPIFVGLSILVAYLSIALKIGGTKLFLRIYDGENPDIKEIFNTYGVFWRFLGQSLLYAIIVMVGFVLLIIPGIIFALMFCFASFIVLDTNTKIVDSLKESANITKGSRWKLLGFFFVLAGVNILGYIALGVGILVSIPVSTFALIHVYRELTKKKAGLTPSPINI